MLLIKQIKLSNFLSHKDTTIRLGEVQKSLLDGPSGVGKSSIVEAIIWNLYGKGRVDNKSLIHHEEDSATVELILNDTKALNSVKITRKVSQAGKQTLTVFSSEDGETWKELEVSGLKNIQEWIEKKLVKASYSLFINSVAFPQDNIENFVKQTSAKRKDLLLEIAGVEDYDLFYNRAKEQLTLGESALVRLETQIADEKIVIDGAKGLEVEIKKLDESVGLTQKRKEAIKDQEVEKQQEYKTLKDNLDLLEKKKQEALDIGLKVTSLSSYITAKNLAIAEVEKKAQEVNKLPAVQENLQAKKKAKVDLDLAIQRGNSWVAEYNKILLEKPQIRDWDSEIKELVKRMSQVVEGMDVKCPAIDNMVCPKLEAQLKAQTDFFEGQIASLRKNEAEANQRLTEYEERIKALGIRPTVDMDFYKQLSDEIGKLEEEQASLMELKAVTGTLEMLKADVVEKEKEWQERQAELQEIKLYVAKYSDPTVLETVAKVEGELKALTLLASTVDSEIMTFKEQLAVKKEFVKMAEKAKEKMVSLQADHQKRHKDVEALKAIKGAFGSRGMKTMIIDYFVPRLEGKINEILGQLSDFRVEIDTQRGSADGESTVEGLFINIINPQGQTMEFASYSGGERLKIIVAISEALASLQNVGFRLMDEAIVGLDSPSIEGFSDVLKEVQDQVSQMLVVSHITEIKEQFDNVITVMKRDGVSFIVEG